MEPRLTEINPKEVLLYLGYKGGALPKTVQQDIARCGDLILKTARPRLIWRQFALGPNRTLQGTDFSPQGEDVWEMLQDCTYVVLFGATLGAEVEALLRRMQVRNVGDAMILDCCASSAIENVCDNFCADLQEAVSPRHLTDRFSPGYGDFPFAQQPEFVDLLDMSRKIGVHLTPGGLMVPQKTVTALLGIADSPQPKRFGGCAHCNLFETCTYRKEGHTCGQT